MNITIIGGGNMGGAIAKGVVASGLVAAGNVTVTRRDTSKLAAFSLLGMSTTSDNAFAVKSADVVLLAVKPWMMEDVCKSIANNVKSDAIIASVAAGVSIDSLTEYFGKKMPFFRVMPNTAAEVGESMSFISSANASKEQEAVVMSVFEKIGMALMIDEAMMGAATALCGCGTAYALRYIRASVEAGVQLGFKADIANRIVAQTVKGAAQLILQNNSHPEVEIDKVTTPKGWTIKGLNAMEDHGFTSAVINGVLAAEK